MNDKLKKDGKVAVLVSPGFGAGWSTWNQDLGAAAVFDADIARAVLEKGDVESVAKAKYPDAYCGGCSDLVVEWVAEGTRFEISEHDGSESLRELGPSDGYVA